MSLLDALKNALFDAPKTTPKFNPNLPPMEQPAQRVNPFAGALAAPPMLPPLSETPPPVAVTPRQPIPLPTFPRLDNAPPLPAPDDIAGKLPSFTSNGFPSALPPVEANQRAFYAPGILPPLSQSGYPSALPPVEANQRNLQLPTFPVLDNAPTENPPTAEQVANAFAPGSLPNYGVKPPTTVPSAFPAFEGALSAATLPPMRPSEQTAAEAAKIEGKKYGFKKDANGKILRDDNGKPLYEKDRDDDHNFLDILKSAGLGFAKGGLPGAIGGAIGGTLDRNFDEKAIDEIKLNRLNTKFASQTQREQAQQGYETRETQRKNIEADNARADDALALRKTTGERNSLLSQVRKMSRYKRGDDPAFDAKLEAANIEQPDFEPARKINPTYYDGSGRKMTYDENGRTVPVLTPDGKEVIDDSKATIYVNDYAVKGRDALAATTAAGVKNTQYSNSDEEDRIKYQNETQEVETFNRGIDAEIQSKRDIAQNLQLANDELRAQRAQLATNPILNSEQIKQIDGQIATNTGQWRTANAEVSALSGKKKPAPIAPKPRQQVSTPQVSKGGNTGKPVAPSKDPMAYFNKTMDEIEDIPQFAKRIKSRYPDYNDIDDFDLVERVVRKHPTYASQVKLPENFRLLQTTSGYQKIDDLYENIGREEGVDPNLLLEQGRKETAFTPENFYGTNKSSAGAVGAGQFMSGTAPKYGLKVENGVDDRTDPVKSIRAQARYMKKLLGDFDGNEDLALAGYNAGEYRPKTLGKGIVPPIPETQDYVKTIRGNLTKLRSQSGTLRQLVGETAQPEQKPVLAVGEGLTGTTDYRTGKFIPNGAPQQYPTFGVNQPAPPDIPGTVLTPPTAPPVQPPSEQSPVDKLFGNRLRLAGQNGENYLQTDDQSGLKENQIRIRNTANDKGGITIATKIIDKDGKESYQIGENISPNQSLPADYQEYLKARELPDSPELRNEYSQTMKAAPEAFQPPPVQKFGPANTSINTAQVPPNQQASVLTQDVPTTLKAGTYDNIREGENSGQRISLDLSNVSGDKNAYINEQAAKQIAAQYNLPEADALKVLEKYPQMHGDGTPFTSEETAAQTSASIRLTPGLIEEIRAKKDSRRPDSKIPFELEDDFQRYVKNGAFKDTSEDRARFLELANAEIARKQTEEDSALRQRAIDEIDRENADAGKFVRDEGGRLKYSENGSLSVSAPTEEEISERIRSIGDAQLDEDSAAQARGDAATLNETLGTKPAALIGGAAGGIAGINRAVAGIFRSVGFDGGYNFFSKAAQKAQVLSNHTGDDGTTTRILKIAGSTPFDVARIIAMTRTGGMVIGFAADHALQAQGAGKERREVGREAEKGAMMGGAFAAATPIAGKVADIFGRGAINFVDAFPSNAAYKAAHIGKAIVREGTEIAVIGHASYRIAEGFGSTDDEASAEMLGNVLFHVVNKAGAKAYDRIYKIYANGKDGTASDVYLDPNGKAKLLTGEVAPDYVDAQIITDPKSLAYQKSETARNITPNRSPETANAAPNGRIGETPAPRELAAENPRRIESAAPEALQRISVDTKAQKIIENIKDGKTYTVEQLQKATRYNKTNVEETLLNLYQAKQIEILPDNSVRFIGGNDVAAVGKSLFERAAAIETPKGNINLPKSSIENEIGSSDSDIKQPSNENVRQSSAFERRSNQETGLPANEKVDDLSIYEALPQQKAQAEAIEKPKAKVDYAERPDTAEKLEVFTERGRKAEIEPKIVNSSDLLTSLDKDYPPEFQPRDRSRAASKAQISEIAGKLNPKFLDDSPKASDGRPLVVPVTMPDGGTKYAVISGNGRTQGIREAYNLDNDGAKRYADFVKSKGETNAKQPVYVGILDPNEVKDLSNFAKEANESPTAQASASERAKSDAERLPTALMGKFAPSDDGTIHSAANRDFVTGFMETVPPTERGALQMPDGSLSQEGAVRVRNAIFAKAFGDSESGLAAIQRMAESTDNNVKNITNGLLAKAGSLATLKEAVKDGTRHQEFDITPSLSKAMEKYADLKESGISVDDYIAQGNLFGAETTPFQTRVMQVFDVHKRSPKAIRSIIGNFTDIAEAAGDPNQNNLFGEKETIDINSAFEAAVKKYEDANQPGRTDQSELFGADENQGLRLRPESNGIVFEDAGQVGTENGESRQNRLEPKDAPLYSIDPTETAITEPLNANREAFERLTYGDEKGEFNRKLLQTAVIRPIGNVIYANADAMELLRQAHGQAFQNGSQDIFLGAYQNPIHTAKVRDALDYGVLGRTLKGRMFLKAFEQAAKNPFGDTQIIATGEGAPRGLKLARQEEAAHQSNYRLGQKDTVSVEVISKKLAGRKAIARLRRGAYQGTDDTMLAKEVGAKLFVDDNKELGLSEKENDELALDLLQKMFDKGAKADDIYNEYSNISEKGKVYVERFKGNKESDSYGSRGNDGENATARSATNGIDRAGVGEIRQRSGTQSDVAFAERPRNAGTGFLDEARSGNRSLAVRTKNEILYSRPSDTEINPDEIKSEAEKATKTLMSYIYDGKRDVSPTEAAMNIMRTGYLAGLSVIKTNLLGNTSNIVIEQLAKPLMATADILNPKAKTRTTPGLSARDVIQGFFGKDGFFRAGFTGDKGVITALVKGVDHQESARVDMNINDKNTNFVRNTGVPAIDVIIEATKRIVTGVDRPFKAYARSAEKSGLARLEASKEALTGAQWRRRMTDLRNSPTAYINDVAERYAEVVTFQNPNAVTATYDKFRRFLIDEKAQARIIPTAAQRKIAKYVGSAAYLGTGQAAPFMSTPSNVGFRTLEYFFPTGVVAAAFKFHRIGQSFERQNFVEEEALHRAKIVKRLAAVRGIQDRAFNKETSEKTERLAAQKKVRNEMLKRSIEDVKNSKVLTDAAKKARIEQLKTTQEKWLESWEANREKYLQTRTGLADKATAQRKVVDDIQRKDWESEDAYADLKFSAFENRAFAEAAGRAGFGASVGSLALLGVIYGLIKAVGTTDYDDEKDKSKEKRAAGIPDDSIAIFGYRFPYADNPFGNALKMGINLFEQYERPGAGLDRASAMAKRFGKDITSLNPLTEQGFSKKDWSSYAGSKANSMTPILNLKILQELGEVFDDKPRKYWEEGFAAQYLIKMPKLRENLPESESFIGGEEERGDIWRRAIRAVDPLKTTKENSSQDDLPVTPSSKQAEADPGKDKKLDDEVRKGKMSADEATRILTEDMNRGDISPSQYRERVKNLSQSKAVNQMTEAGAGDERDFAAIEKILKNAPPEDKPLLEKVLIDKAKAKFNSKTNKGTADGQKLLEIHTKYFAPE